MDESGRHAGIIGALIGIVATPCALWMALISSGMGHGHYVCARLLFPLPILITRLTDNSILLPSIALALAEFPLYGFVVGRRQWGILLALIAIHLAAASFCFSGVIPNFS